MDDEISTQVTSLTEAIYPKLNEIRYVTSLKQLVVVFQELVVKLLQFSSKVHQFKKASKNELQKESLKLLLKSIKDSIPELSQACQQSLQTNEHKAIKRKEDTIKKLVYAVEKADDIVRKEMEINEWKLQNYSRKDALVKKGHYSPGQSDFDDDIKSTQMASLSLSDSFLLPESMRFSPSNSVVSRTNNSNSGKFDFDEISAIYKQINRQSRKMLQDQEILFSSDKYIKENFGTKLLQEIDKYVSIAKSFEHKKSQDASDFAKRCDEFHELGLDYISMFIDFNSSEMPDDDFDILVNVQKHLEKYLNDIMETVEKFRREESNLMSKELIKGGEIIKEIPGYVNKRNYIGLADATCLFIEKCEDSKKMLKEMVGTNLQEQYQNFERKFQRGLSEIEVISDELIENIKDRKALQMLMTSMQNVIELLNEFRGFLLTNLPAPDGMECTSLVKKEATEDILKEKDSNEEKSNFSLLIDQFPKAISDNDYKTVEILANRFLGNIKLVGELLQGISHQSTKDVRDLRQLFAKYFKTAGGFCSQARKAVLSDVFDDGNIIENLIKTGHEMEHMKNRFLSRCRASLKPWFEVSHAAHNKICRETVEQKLDFFDITKRLKRIIEALSDTEYLETKETKKKLMKLSTVITNTSDSITKRKMQESKNISPNDAFLLEMYELQWACAVMSILEIVDKIAASCLQYRPNMKTDELLATTATWISMLQTLSQCCTDTEASNEIYKLIGELTSLDETLKNWQDDGDFDEKLELAIIRRQIFASILLIMELIDILTKGVQEPMRGYIDPLASLSFAPALQSYIVIRDAFHDKMDTVHTMSCLAVQDSVIRSKAHLVFMAADELQNISQDLISTLRSSKENPKSKLNFLKLRWRLAATYLIKVLLTAPDANYTAVAGVMHHLQSTSHIAKYDELIAILKDVGTKKGFSKDSWKLKRETIPEEFFPDDIGTDYNSSMNSVLDYPISRDTDNLMSSSPMIDSHETSYFRNYSNNLKENSTPAHPLIQTPDTFNPQSSFSSTRTSSSQDTEIFIPKAARRASPGSLNNPERGYQQKQNDAAQSEVFVEKGGGASWESPKKDDADGPVVVRNESKISKSIAAAAQILLRELEEWEEDGNSIITVVKKMTKQMLEMADYAKGKGELRSKEDFIHTAKAIAANAQIVAKFAVIIADYCLDETCQLNLLHYAEIVPTLSTQLNIIASVKAATPNDETADIMLIGNAENLMRSVSGTLKAAESASVKMRSDSETDDGQPRSKSAALAVKWKKKLDLRRSMESITAPTNELGLKIIREDSSLSLTDL